MKILNILVEGPTKLSSQVIEVLSKDHEVKTIELSKKNYDSIIDEISSHDKVISW